jgi:DNA-binding NarL/FixJ family response regulator
MGHSESEKYSILLVDDHPLVRRGIRRIIEENPELKVVGEVNDGLEFLEFLEKCVPNLVILDLSMPRIGGIEATQKAKARHPQLKILVLTMHKSREYLEESLAAGAEGYVVKETLDLELLPAIAALRHGGTYISKLCAAL